MEVLQKSTHGLRSRIYHPMTLSKSWSPICHVSVRHPSISRALVKPGTRRTGCARFLQQITSEHPRFPQMGEEKCWPVGVGSDGQNQIAIRFNRDLNRVDDSIQALQDSIWVIRDSILIRFGISRFDSRNTRFGHKSRHRQQLIFCILEFNFLTKNASECRILHQNIQKFSEIPPDHKQQEGDSLAHPS